MSSSRRKLRTVNIGVKMTEQPGASPKNQFLGVLSRKRKLNSLDDKLGEDPLPLLEASKIEFASDLIIKYLHDAINDKLQCCDDDIQAQARYRSALLGCLYSNIIHLLFTSHNRPTARALDLVVACYREKNYHPLIKYELSRGRSFRDDLFERDRTVTDAQSSKELFAKVESVISTFSPVLKDYARGALDYQFFPRHEGKSFHADVHNAAAETVHLLLSGLGDPERGSLTDWRRIYKSDEPSCSFFTTYVVDLPGYGKTRLLFEGVLEFFAIYFSCSKEELTWATGSGDVAWVLKTISEIRNLDLETWQKDGIEKRTFYMLLYSRLAVLRHFLRYLLDFDISPLDARRRLLLQACPPCSSDNTDIFLEVTKIAHLCSTEVLAKQTELALQDCNGSVAQLLKKHASSDCPKLHVLIDEVQVVAQKYKALSNLWKNPVLVAFVELVQEVIHPRSIIAGASGLPVDDIHLVPLYSSGIKFRTGDASVTTTRIWPDGSDKNGGDGKMFCDWILDHLPELVDVPGLLDRIQKWLPSRPRLIAELLEMYMQAEQRFGDRTKIPYHRILSQAFCASTGFRPMDGVIYEGMEEDLSEAMTGLSFQCGIMTMHERLKRDGLEQDTRLLQLSSKMLYSWILSSKDSSNLELDSYSVVKLIDIGLTPLPSLPARNPTSFRCNAGKTVAMTEPFSSLSYMALLSSTNRDVFKKYMVEALLYISDKASLFENLTVFVLMENLGKPDGCCLSDVICFKNPAPSWAASRYRLIALVKDESDGTFTSVPVIWNSGASPRLGFKPAKPEEFHQWLVDPHGIPFIFPDVHHGAEGFAVLENTVTKERVFLAVQNKVAQNEPFLDTNNVLQNSYELECKPPADTHMLEIWPTLTSDISQTEQVIIENEKFLEGVKEREGPRVIHVVATIHDDAEYQWALDRYNSSTLGVLRLNAISAYNKHIISQLRRMADDFYSTAIDLDDVQFASE
ncbi:uncharacterized protein EV420DRAFT_1766975 [Desarmillaria tabescens]|uniref:Uncharacterized protein n=1 Tax=Armillaria tabescens TaxID=1929756 RepID=A0AA39JV99_ARMTA|nr:uncharacterized protein EV420DRAFT_1766975 [Desarmillaria tabescens]KAK0449572.1 hypothetical protein EV420DRAFT_1766975 [Desarmillaria tabescens]